MERSIEKQTIHDRVVNQIGNYLNQQKFDIYVNPGQEKNAGIGDNFPDVILTDKGTTKVRFILEVETEDSVTAEEANKQWKTYSTTINATLYLVIPEKSEKRAKELCQQVGINVRYITYIIDNNDLLTFKFN
ncbi:MAG: hypothetical protein MJZ34_15985 [Paludibacteraceae bacterium]|nr:hypothetical protein [Paludibacteraceae bacterium]